MNIIGLDNGAGLSREASLMLSTLRHAGIEARWSIGRRPRPILTRLRKLPFAGLVFRTIDVNLFLEQLHPGWFPFSRCNVLFPNPEWFLDESAQYLDFVSHVLCKTREAEEIFRKLGKPSSWTGFTSEDHSDGRIAAGMPLKALHVAGRSEHKGTAAVIEAWAKHPEWPELTVVRRPIDAGSVLNLPAVPNVRYFTERLPEEHLLELQRTTPVHVLPSEVEAYGQSLVESLSVGAIVITTDAMPMNEVVGADRGVLVPWDRLEAFRLGTRYWVVQDALENAISEVFSWSPERRLERGHAARAWFEANDRAFRQHFPKVIESLAAVDARPVHGATD